MVNNVYTNNINALDSDLKEVIQNHQLIESPQLKMTNGYNLVYRDTPLHSEISPLDESKAIFNNSKNTKDIVHVVYGLGLGYLFQIASQNAQGRVVLYEPNLDILYAAFTLVDFSQDFKKDNVKIFTDIDKLKSYLGSTATKDTEIQVLSLPSYRTLFEEEFNQDLEIIRLAYGSNVLDYGFKRHKLQYVTRNILMNIQTIFDTSPVNMYEDLYDGKTAIIVSAGPTLGQNIETLKKYQDNAIIFTVGTALKTLVKHKIKTDYLCMIEACNITKQVEGVDLSNMDLILEPYTSSEIFKLNTRKKILHISDNMPSSKYLGAAAGIPTEGYFTQGTVSFLALNTAVKMGFKKIILIGQDLAYIDGQCYSKNSAYEDLVCKYNPNNGKYEIGVKDFEKFASSFSASKDKEEQLKTATERLISLNKSLFTVRGIEGKQIPTEAGYASFINHFADYAKSLKGIELINTSLKGAQIDGFENISLEDAMKDSEPTERKDLETEYEFDKKGITSALTNSLNNLKEYLEIIEECQKTVSRLETEVKHNKSVDKEKLLKVRELLLVYQKINNIEHDNEIFRFVTANSEMNLNDFMKTVAKYDETTLPDVVDNLKIYYDSIKRTVEHFIKLIEGIL